MDYLNDIDESILGSLLSTPLTPNFIPDDIETVHLEGLLGVLQSLQKPTSMVQQVESTGEKKFPGEIHYNFPTDYRPLSGVEGTTVDDKRFLKTLAKTESGGNYFIKPNKSGYEGMYQFRYRRGDDGLKYAKTMGVSPSEIRKSPELQDRMMLMALKDYDSQLRGAGLKVTNYTRWLRHNQGLGGAKAILKGHLSSIIRRNIRNQGVTGSTDSELIRNYHKKFRHRFI